MKRFAALACVLCMLMTVLVGCGGGSGSGSGAEGETYTLKFASQDAEELPTTQGMYWIAEQVNERTDGAVTIDVYPANQLGEAKLLYEGIMDGSIDMYMGYLDSTYDKMFDMVAVPYLASNFDEIKYLCSEDSNLFKIYQEHCEGTDMKFLGFYLNGINAVFGTKEVKDYLDPSKSKGLLCRTAASETTKMGIEALGFSTVTIPWSDCYTSLQTGVMDCMTGIPSYQVAVTFGDIAKYYVPYNEFMEAQCILMSPSTFDNLPEEYVQIIQEVCQEASLASVDESEANIAQGEKDLADMGITVYEMTDEQREEIAEYVRNETRPALDKYFGADNMALIDEDLANAAK